MKSVIQLENGASRFVNANKVRNLQSKLPVCQSAVSMIKNVIGASFEIMNILKPNAFEVFIKVASLIDYYISTVFYQFSGQDLEKKLF